MVDSIGVWEYLFNPKALASILFALVNFITALFILSDLVKHRLMPDRWRRAMYALSVALLFNAGFGVSRFIDALADAKFLAEHPGAITTLSQEFDLVLEAPLFAAGAAIFLFLIFLNIAYYKKGKPTA